MKEKITLENRPGFFKGYGNGRLFLLRLAAFLCTALCYPLISAPLNWWPLHWVAWVPFLWATFSQKGRGRILFSYLGGTLANLLLLYWIVDLISNFTNISRLISILLVFLLCSYLSLQWILFAFFIPKFRIRFPRLWIYISPAMVVAVELLMPQIFPYMQGVSHYQVIPIIQLASITGVFGVSYLLFFANCVFYHCGSRFKTSGKISLEPLLVLVIILGLVIAYGLKRQQEYQQKSDQARILRVGLIQSNITPYDRRQMGFNKIWRLYLELSQKAVKKGAQWVIWSEGEFQIPISSSAGQLFLSQASHLLKRPLLLGCYDIVIENNKRYKVNSAVHFDPVKGLGKRYDKQILVPFGEYMPFEKQFDFIYRQIRWRSRFSPGKGPVVQSLEGIHYGFLICYEAIFPSLVRKSVQHGAELLVNITYDAWYGRTSAPHQHLLLATIRSVENGIPLIRLGTTGFSTVIDSLGRIGSKSRLFEQDVLIHDIKLVHLPSLYTRIGNTFAWLCVFICIMVGVCMAFKKGSGRGGRK